MSLTPHLNQNEELKFPKIRLCFSKVFPLCTSILHIFRLSPNTRLRGLLSSIPLIFGNYIDIHIPLSGICQGTPHCIWLCGMVFHLLLFDHCLIGASFPYCSLHFGLLWILFCLSLLVPYFRITYLLVAAPSGESLCLHDRVFGSCNKASATSF